MKKKKKVQVSKTFHLVFLFKHMHIYTHTHTHTHKCTNFGIIILTINYLPFFFVILKLWQLVKSQKCYVFNTNRILKPILKKREIYEIIEDIDYWSNNGHWHPEPNLRALCLPQAMDSSHKFKLYQEESFGHSQLFYEWSFHKMTHQLS